jgi:hypothetical protein
MKSIITGIIIAIFSTFIYYNFLYIPGKAIVTGMNKDLTRSLDELNRSLDNMGQTGNVPAINDKNPFAETQKSAAAAQKEAGNNLLAFSLVMIILSCSGAFVVFKLTSNSTSNYRRKK